MCVCVTGPGDLIQRIQGVCVCVCVCDRTRGPDTEDTRCVCVCDRTRGPDTEDTRCVCV